MSNVTQENELDPHLRFLVTERQIFQKARTDIDEELPLDENQI